jgi:putative transposase
VSAYVDQHRERFGVEPICRTLEVSASAYYRRASGERSAREVDDERLLEVIRQTHKENYFAYGYRRMWKALIRAGERVPRCRVQRLMAEHAIQGAKRRGKPWRTTRTDPRALRSPDLVKRDFTAERPNALWVCDFTYLRCWEGVLYFSFVIDVYSRMIVGWQLAQNMRDTLVLDALRMALGLREHGADVQLVHHSDAGSQYTSGDYTQTLTDQRVLGSIGTVGDAYDNALAESFVDSYKTELIADRVWRSRAEVEFATVEWVAWFNHARLHGSLGDIPPAEFEALDAPKSIAPTVGRGDPVGARTTHRAPAIGVDPAAHSPIAPVSAPVARSELGSGRPNSAQGTNGRGWPLRPTGQRHTH